MNLEYVFMHQLKWIVLTSLKDALLTNTLMKYLENARHVIQLAKLALENMIVTVLVVKEVNTFIKNQHMIFTVKFAIQFPCIMGHLENVLKDAVMVKIMGLINVKMGIFLMVMDVPRIVLLKMVFLAME